MKQNGTIQIALAAAVTTVLALSSQAKADVTVVTCASLTSIQPGGETTVIPASFVVTQSDDRQTTTVASDFLGRKSTTTDVIVTEAPIDDRATANELVGSVAPGTDPSRIAKGIFIELPNGMNNDAPIKLVDLREANGVSVVTIIDVGGGALMGRCTK